MYKNNCPISHLATFTNLMWSHQINCFPRKNVLLYDCTYKSTGKDYQRQSRFNCVSSKALPLVTLNDKQWLWKQLLPVLQPLTGFSERWKQAEENPHPVVLLHEVVQAMARGGEPRVRETEQVTCRAASILKKMTKMGSFPLTSN